MRRFHASIVWESLNDRPGDRTRKKTTWKKIEYTWVARVDKKWFSSLRKWTRENFHGVCD